MTGIIFPETIDIIRTLEQTTVELYLEQQHDEFDLKQLDKGSFSRLFTAK